MKKVKPNINPAVSNDGGVSASKQYDLLVFIGRFQPYHLGHKRVVDKALEMAKNVLIIVGSANKARSNRNPFTFEERMYMIDQAHDNDPALRFASVSDSAYNDTMWVSEVQKIVHREALAVANPDGFQNNGTADIKIGLIGCAKDHTSYYLKLFPQWGSVPVEHVNPLNATNIRQMYFEDRLAGRWEWDAIVPDATYQFLQSFHVTAEYERLEKEHVFLRDYKEKWGEGPFLTADSLVQVSGHVLLIKRGKEYGQGLYALPGGFLNKHEKFLDGAIRELKEETRLKVPVPVLKGSMVASDVFDDPHRSERGRIVTVCHHFRLTNELELPEVRGSDDADWAGFVDFSALKEEDFFEDHYHIIRKMLGV